MEYLHYQLMKNTNTGKLEKDNLVIELLKQITQTIAPNLVEKDLSDNLKKYHLVTIEKAKEYIHEHWKRPRLV